MPFLSVVDCFEKGCDSLPAADAHGHKRVSAADADEFVKRLHGDDGAGVLQDALEGWTVPHDLLEVHVATDFFFQIELLLRKLLFQV